MRCLKSVLLCGWVCAAASFQASPAQAQIEADSASISSPAAWIYVSVTPKNSSVNEIAGYVVAPDGSLAPLPGSPWTADVSSMAANGKFLFGSDKNSVYIDAYHINQTTGALSQWSQTDVVRMNPQDCGQPGQLVLDHTGATLYNFEVNDNGCANNDYRSLAIDRANGSLSNLGTTQGNDWLTGTPTILASDVYAYSASCIGNMYWGIWGYKRQSSGNLTDLRNFTRTLPDPKSGDFWCPSHPASDPSGHVAIVMQAVNGSTFNSDGGPQIASFTADAQGNLSTTNTEADMPASLVGMPLSSSMSFDGKLLAVGGTAGLQIFHFNGAEPATRDGGLMTNVEIDQIFWDKKGHLYAISRPSGKLYVFNVTAAAASEAPGSPHTIASPQDLVVQPLPLPWN